MKKLLLLALCLGALAGRARAQAAPPDLIVVRIFETFDQVKLVVTRGVGNSEITEFANSAKDVGLTKASESYYRVLYSLYKEGYVLQGAIAPSGSPYGSNSVGSAAGGFTTLIFTKKQ